MTTPTNFIAMHTFVEMPFGLACRDCGKRFVDISGTTKADIGKHGIAQVGHLTESEFNQIKAKCDLIWTAVVEGAAT